MLDNGLAGLDGPGMGSWLMYVCKTCLTLGPGGVDISPEYFHFPALSINILFPNGGLTLNRVTSKIWFRCSVEHRENCLIAT